MQCLPNQYNISKAKISRTDENMIAAYKDICEYLEARWYKPQLNATNNKCSNTVKNYTRHKNIALATGGAWKSQGEQSGVHNQSIQK